MLADVLTMTDHCGKRWRSCRSATWGKAGQHANSLLVTGATLGMDARICARPGCSPSAEIRGIAAGLAAGSGARLLVTEDVNAGVAEVDFVYTDVWLSLGEPEDQWDTRLAGGHRSRTRSSRGCEQQISALPSAGSSTGSGA